MFFLVSFSIYQLLVYGLAKISKTKKKQIRSILYLSDSSFNSVESKLLPSELREDFQLWTFLSSLDEQVEFQSDWMKISSVGVVNCKVINFSLTRILKELQLSSIIFHKIGEELIFCSKNNQKWNYRENENTQQSNSGGIQEATIHYFSPSTCQRLTELWAKNSLRIKIIKLATNTNSP